MRVASSVKFCGSDHCLSFLGAFQVQRAFTYRNPPDFAFHNTQWTVTVLLGSSVSFEETGEAGMAQR